MVFYLLDSSVYIDTQHFSNKDYKNEFENVSGHVWNWNWFPYAQVQTGKYCQGSELGYLCLQ